MATGYLFIYTATYKSYYYSIFIAFNLKNILIIDYPIIISWADTLLAQTAVLDISLCPHPSARGGFTLTRRAIEFCDSCISGARTPMDMISAVAGAGFKINIIEDHSLLLKLGSPARDNKKDIA